MGRITFNHNPWKTCTYAEVRRGPVGVLVVCVYAAEGLHRTTKEAVGIPGIAVLPVVPQLVDHLS